MAIIDVAIFGIALIDSEFFGVIAHEGAIFGRGLYSFSSDNDHHY